MPKQVMRMSKFQGLNVDTDEALMETYELVKADNAEIIDNGKLAKSHGTEFVNKTSLDGKAIQMFEWARDDGTVLRFARVYTEDDNGFGSVSLVRVLDDGTTSLIYENSIKIKTNFKTEFTKGYEIDPNLTICGVMQPVEIDGVKMDSGLNSCRNLIYDGNKYLYAALKENRYIKGNRYPVNIVKINILSMVVVGVCTYSNGKMDSPDVELAYDGTYLYMALMVGYDLDGDARTWLVKIDVSTMTTISQFRIEGEYCKKTWESLIALKYIDGYLYLFTKYIRKINVETFSVEKTSPTLYSSKDSRHLRFSDVVYDDDYFYVAFHNDPAGVFKIDRENLEVKKTVFAPSGYNGCFAAAIIPEDDDKKGPYMFLGTNTAPAKIVKVNLDSMEVVNYTSLNNGINYCRGLVYDKTNDVLFAAMSTAPGKILVINPSTLDVIGTLTLPVGEDGCNALQLINNRLYIGLGTSPAQILIYNASITYDFDVKTIDEANKKTGVFSLKDVLYLLTGTNYLQYNGDVVAEVAEETEDEEGKEVTDCDLDPIRGCTMAVWHPTSFRIFFAGDGSNKLYYSERNDPRWVKKAGYVVPTTGDGPITGLVLFMDSILVFFQRSAWIWTGQDPEKDVTWKRIPLTEGTESFATLENGTSQLEWLGSGSGYWTMAPAMTGVTAVLNPSQNLLGNLAENKITKIIKAIKNRKLACSAYDTKERKTYLAYCDDSTLNYCNKMLIRNADIPQSFTRLVDQQIYDLMYTSEGDLWIATENYIVKRCEHYKQTLPDGTYGAIAFNILTPATVMGNPRREKWIHSMAVQFKNPGTGYKLNITLYVDSKINTEITYTTTDDDGEDVTYRYDDIYDAIGKRIAVGITNSQEMDTVIYEIALQYSFCSNYGGAI